MHTNNAAIFALKVHFILKKVLQTTIKPNFVTRNIFKKRYTTKARMMICRRNIPIGVPLDLSHKEVGRGHAVYRIFMFTRNKISFYMEESPGLEDKIQLSLHSSAQTCKL